MKKIFNKIYPVVIGVAVASIITAIVTFILTTAYYSHSIAKLKIVEGYLDERYYGEYNKDKAIDYAIKGYVSSLGDPYTEYFTAAEYKEFYNNLSGEFCGIGVSVQYETEKNVILVVDVFEDSPAKNAGIQEGDIITKVNGVPYTGEQLNEAANNMKGEENTEVTVTVLKKDTETETDLKMIRKKLVANTVESEVMGGNIGYIYISQFGTNTAAEYMTHLDNLLEKKVDGLIIDVRNNGGGSTETVEAIASSVLPKNAVIYYTSDKYDNKEYYTSNMDGTNIPLVVLANEYSASASEIFVGAVKDNNRGTVVGTKTYGKGVVQEIITMNDGSALKVTIQRYYTPNGHYINGKGIEPDHKVELAEDKDNQLEKALEILKNQ